MRITATLPYGPVGSTTCTVEATFTSGTSKRFFIGTHGLRRTYVGFREPVRISTRKKDFAYRVRRFRSPPIAGASQLVIGLTRCDPEDPQRSSICSGTYRAAGTFRFLWGALSDLPGELSWQLNTPRAPEPRPPASCLESDWGRIVVENAFEPFLEGGAVTVLRKRLLRDRRFMATREEQLESSSTVSVIRNQAMLIPASR